MYSNDTICALATPVGGAIAVIRVSGPQSITITDHIFNGRRKLAEARPNTVLYGTISDSENNIVDDVLISIFKAPHSYTGEDSTEISCHGSKFIITQILNILIKNGCRQANPGEYTQRAYLNGKMDLSQAEAVADLIASTNKLSHNVAISQMRGFFSNELSMLRQQLLKMCSLLELELDFSDHEELEFADRTELMNLAEKICIHIKKLANSFKTGQAIKNGIPVAIIGKTNVGKSTLLNQLLKDERAIVSDIHGTTRDVIEDVIEICGIQFRFIDTAGIRQTSDTIEKIGIERTYQKVSQAELVIWVVDAVPTVEEIKEIMSITEGKTVIIAHNKSDISNNNANIPTLLPCHWKEIHISAKNNIGIEQLELLISDSAQISDINESDVIITSTRHYNSLLQANESLLRIINGLEQNIPGDLLCEDLRISLTQLAEITGEGQITPQEVLDNIFQHFCIGK